MTKKNGGVSGVIEREKNVFGLAEYEEKVKQWMLKVNAT
jgi:hypothetical protein